MERKFQDNAHIEDLLQCLSGRRLQPYLRAAKGDLHTALGLYRHNLLWSARLWIFMHLLEVSLRNRVDEMLCNLHGEDWLMPERVLLRPREIEKVLEAEAKLESLNKTITRDGIIAELNFGFWVFLFSRKYDDGVRAFWRKALHRLFPGQPRRKVHDTLQKIRLLRNRLAHHERIHDPRKAREMMLATLRNLSPAMAAWAEMTENGIGSTA